MTKISEIGANKVFRLVMNNGKVVVAKIPHHRSTSGALRVASEVATMDFASRILGLPVPKVLAWDAKEDCGVGTEYILMEEARGTLLESCWDGLTPDCQAEIVGQLASAAAKFQSVSFSRIGNIYFAADNIPGSSPAIVDGPLPPDLKAKIQRNYTIGPTVDSSYWDEDRAKIVGVQGPWNDSRAWLKAIAAREITWLQKYAPERKQLPLLPSPKGTRAEHIKLWQKFDAATDFVTAVSPRFQRPTLWHGDLCVTNIFVKKNKITAIIDWEGSWVTPLIFAIRQPRMLMRQPGLLFQVPNPDQIASLPDGPEKDRAMQSFIWYYIRYAYQTELERSSPVFEQVEQIPLVTTLQQLVLQAADTWTAGAVPLRGCLITLSKHWEELCPHRPCPYSFTQDELDQQASEGDPFGPLAALMFTAQQDAQGEGFVKREKFDVVFEVFKRSREHALKTLEGNARDEVAAALAWTIKQ